MTDKTEKKADTTEAKEATKRERTAISRATTAILEATRRSKVLKDRIERLNEQLSVATTAQQKALEELQAAKAAYEAELQKVT